MRAMIAMLCAASMAAAQTPDVVNEVQLLYSSLKEDPKAKPAAGSIEEAIATALQRHPDLQVAQAQRAMADAVLEKAKLEVTQKVATAFAKLQGGKAKQAELEAVLARIKAAATVGKVDATELQAAEAALSAAKQAVDILKVELETAKGGPAKPALTLYPTLTGTTSTAPLGTLAFANPSVTNLQVHPAGTTGTAVFTDQDKRKYSLWLTTRDKLGTTGDKLKALIEKKVTLDLKQDGLPENFAALLKAAGEAGFTVRFPESARKELYGNAPKVGPLKGEQTFLAWTQLMMDDFTQAIPVDERFAHDIYVREYGLLIASVKTAPPGAIPLSEFAKQMRDEVRMKELEEKRALDAKRAAEEAAKKAEDERKRLLPPAAEPKK